MVTEPDMTRISILDPTSPPLPAEARVAERPDTLNGKVIGLLDNHKHNASELLDSIQEMLSERYEFANVVRRSKHDVSRPCPTDTIEELVKECDVVITAVGD